MNIDTAVNYDLQKENVGTRNRHIVLAHRLFNYPFSIPTDFLLEKRLISTASYVRFIERYYSLKQQMVNPVFCKLFDKNSQPIELDEEWKSRLVLAFRESNHRLEGLVDIDLPKYGYIW